MRTALLDGAGGFATFLPERSSLADEAVTHNCEANIFTSSLFTTSSSSSSVLLPTSRAAPATGRSLGQRSRAATATCFAADFFRAQTTSPDEGGFARRWLLPTMSSSFEVHPTGSTSSPTTAAVASTCSGKSHDYYAAASTPQKDYSKYRAKDSSSTLQVGQYSLSPPKSLIFPSERQEKLFPEKRRTAFNLLAMGTYPDRVISQDDIRPDEIDPRGEDFPTNIRAEGASIFGKQAAGTASMAFRKATYAAKEAEVAIVRTRDLMHQLAHVQYHPDEYCYIQHRKPTSADLEGLGEDEATAEAETAEEDVVEQTPTDMEGGDDGEGGHNKYSRLITNIVDLLITM